MGELNGPLIVSYIDSFFYSIVLLILSLLSPEICQRASFIFASSTYVAWQRITYVLKCATSETAIDPSVLIISGEVKKLSGNKELKVVIMRSKPYPVF